ncbi:MAG TPA: undecaprenyl/decaprenyl-phosphate alpha-N-acetylglucosaminyl 1-phosphate transferase, partial [Limnochordia bacterium]
FLLAAIAVEGALKGATAIALTVPVLALGLPVLDTAFAIIRRWRGRVPVSQGDRGHVHHRLLALGLSERQAVAVLYAISGLLGLAALGLTELTVAQGAVIFAAVGLLAALAAFKLGVMEARPARRSPPAASRSGPRAL